MPNGPNPDFPAAAISLRDQTQEEISADFRAMVQELGGSPHDLAERMRKLGDYRHIEVTLRGLQRMLTGETRVSGEMKALMTMMLRQQRRLTKKYANLKWTELKDGSVTAATDEFRMTLTPQSRGRWRVDVFHRDGYSHDWPRWQDNLEVAKQKAVTILDDAMDTMIEYEMIEQSVTGKKMQQVEKERDVR